VSAIDELLQNNETYAESFDKGSLPAAPAKKVAVLACMDARFDVHKVLGLEEGDAHVIRNAGGFVTEDAIRSLIISQRKLGTEEIILLHHTQCGMLGLAEDELKDQLREETGAHPPFDLGAIDDLEESVRTSIRKIVDNPFIASTGEVRGFIYDVKTGRLSEVARSGS
jgi:carbonic anhydrase